MSRKFWLEKVLTFSHGVVKANLALSDSLENEPAQHRDWKAGDWTK